MKNPCILFPLFLLPGLTFSQQIPHPPCDFYDREAHVLNFCEISSQISFPPLAYQNRIEGRVQVRVYMNAHGQYQSHEILSTPHPVLSQALSPYLPYLIFEAPEHNGKRVAGCISLPFSFSIQALPTRQPFSCKPKPNEAVPILAKQLNK